LFTASSIRQLPSSLLLFQGYLEDRLAGKAATRPTAKKLAR
jgi:hypothetical protein